MTAYFESYKGRQVEVGQRVRVYRNLHRGPGVWFSIQDAKTRRVLGHTQAVLLSRATFEVSEAGRQRVLATGKKNVHAFVVGRYSGPFYAGWRADYGTGTAVTYNPYKHTGFVAKDAVPLVTASGTTLQRPVTQAGLALVDHVLGVVAQAWR